MKRRTFLRFLAATPAIANVDIVDTISKIPRPLTDAERYMLMIQRMNALYAEELERIVLWGSRYYTKSLGPSFRTTKGIYDLINHSSTHQFLNGSDNKT